MMALACAMPLSAQDAGDDAAQDPQVLDDGTIVVQGTRVVVLRDRYSDGYRLVPLGPEA